MPTLKEQLLTDSTRPTLVRECTNLVDQEVAEKRGLSGMAIKGAYKTVKAIKRGFVPGVVDFLLDEWVEQLEGYYQDFLSQGGTDFAAYINGRRSQVAESLLEVTDKRATTTTHRTAGRVYGKLRPSAKKNVAEAVPKLARIVQGHLSD
jgi:hypothetical protein